MGDGRFGWEGLYGRFGWEKHSCIDMNSSMLKGLLPLQRGLKSLKFPLFMTFDSTATPFKGLLPLQRGLKSLKFSSFVTFDSTATPGFQP